MSVLDLARPEIVALQPYSSARMEASGGQVLLNANESAWAPVGDAGFDCHRYPDPQPQALLTALADLYRVRCDQLLIGRGSDEAIDLLVRAFCRAGRDAIAVQPPTFGMYVVCARVQDAEVIEVPLAADFSLDVDALLAALTSAVKLVFVCSPNNPTGQAVPRASIERLARALAGRALLVVDEAYVEFADADAPVFDAPVFGAPVVNEPVVDAPHAGTAGSVIDLLDRHENLAVLRTLSKAWALAGVRIGCLLAHTQVIALLRRIMPPYPLPRPCIEMALAALSPAGQALVRERIDIIRAQRFRMAQALRRVSGVREVLPSQANFLTVRFDDAGAVYRRLLAAGIVVRDVRRYPNLGDALRITLGTSAENDSVLSVLREAVA